MKVTKKTKGAAPVVAGTEKSVVAAKTGRDEAVEYIMSAIQALGACTNDKIAKESIANLSVVALDLRASTEKT